MASAVPALAGEMWLEVLLQGVLWLILSLKEVLKESKVRKALIRIIQTSTAISANNPNEGV